MPPRHVFFENLPKPDSPFAKFYKTHDELLIHAFLKRGETEWYDFSSSNLYRKYGEDYYAKFADSAHRRLKSWGMNTIANSSDTAICLQDRTPYAERVECISRFIEGTHGHWWKFRDPFDPSFTEGVRKALEEHGREAHDPWCIGFFVDNEINWGDGDTDLARWTLASPKDQPARIAFMEYLKRKRRGRGGRHRPRASRVHGNHHREVFPEDAGDIEGIRSAAALPRLPFRRRPGARGGDLRAILRHH